MTKSLISTQDYSRIYDVVTTMILLSGVFKDGFTPDEACLHMSVMACGSRSEGFVAETKTVPSKKIKPKTSDTTRKGLDMDKTRNGCPFCGLGPVTTLLDPGKGHQAEFVNCGSRGPKGMKISEAALKVWDAGDPPYQRPHCGFQLDTNSKN